ncbi:unnamed protein product [Gadus morhua 'NCC']
MQNIQAGDVRRWLRTLGSGPFKTSPIITSLSPRRVLSTSGLKRSSSLREDSGSSPVGYRAPVMGDKLAISSLRWSSGRGEMVAVPRESQNFSHQGEGSRLQPDMKLKSWGRKWPSSGEFWSPGLGGRTGPSPPRERTPFRGRCVRLHPVTQLHSWVKGHYTQGDAELQSGREGGGKGSISS